MITIKGKFKAERISPPSKTGYVVRGIFVEEEGSVFPRFVAVSKEYVCPKVGADVELAIGYKAWDDRSKRFSSRGVQLYALKKVVSKA